MKKQMSNPWGYVERGIVIGGIEPRINRRRSFDLQSHFSFQSSTTLKKCNQKTLLYKMTWNAS